MTLINDNQQLISATSEFNIAIKTYDDGSGPLWLYRDAGGYRTIVRAAQTWEDAYNVVIDEMPTIPQEDVIEAYGFYVLPDNVFDRNQAKIWTLYYDDGSGRVSHGEYATEQKALDRCTDLLNTGEYDLIEGYRYQSNSSGTGIVSIDLNGEDLSPLTAELAKDLNITVTVQDYEQISLELECP